MVGAGLSDTLFSFISLQSTRNIKKSTYIRIYFIYSDYSYHMVQLYQVDKKGMNSNDFKHDALLLDISQVVLTSSSSSSSITEINVPNIEEKHGSSDNLSNSSPHQPLGSRFNSSNTGLSELILDSGFVNGNFSSDKLTKLRLDNCLHEFSDLNDENSRPNSSRTTQKSKKIHVSTGNFNHNRIPKQLDIARRFSRLTHLNLSGCDSSDLCSSLSSKINHRSKATPKSFNFEFDLNWLSGFPLLESLNLSKLEITKFYLSKPDSESRKTFCYAPKSLQCLILSGNLLANDDLSCLVSWLLVPDNEIFTGFCFLKWLDLSRNSFNSPRYLENGEFHENYSSPNWSALGRLCKPTHTRSPATSEICCALKHLDLSGNRLFSVPRFIGRLIPCLEWLSMDECELEDLSLFTGSSRGLVAGKTQSKLRHLSLALNHRLSSEHLIALLTGPTRMSVKWLDLSHTDLLNELIKYVINEDEDGADRSSTATFDKSPIFNDWNFMLSRLSRLETLRLGFQLKLSTADAKSKLRRIIGKLKIWFARLRTKSSHRLSNLSLDFQYENAVFNTFQDFVAVDIECLLMVKATKTTQKEPPIKPSQPATDKNIDLLERETNSLEILSDTILNSLILDTSTRSVSKSNFQSSSIKVSSKVNQKSHNPICESKQKPDHKNAPENTHSKIFEQNDRKLVAQKTISSKNGPLIGASSKLFPHGGHKYPSDEIYAWINKCMQGWKDLQTQNGQHNSNYQSRLLVYELSTSAKKLSRPENSFRQLPLISDEIFGECIGSRVKINAARCMLFVRLDFGNANEYDEIAAKFPRLQLIYWVGSLSNQKQQALTAIFSAGLRDYLCGLPGMPIIEKLERMESTEKLIEFLNSTHLSNEFNSSFFDSRNSQSTSNCWFELVSVGRQCDDNEWATELQAPVNDLHVECPELSDTKISKNSASNESKEDKSLKRHPKLTFTKNLSSSDLLLFKLQSKQPKIQQLAPHISSLVKPEENCASFVLFELCRKKCWIIPTDARYPWYGKVIGKKSKVLDARASLFAQSLSRNNHTHVDEIERVNDVKDLCEPKLLEILLDKISLLKSPLDTFINRPNFHPILETKNSEKFLLLEFSVGNDMSMKVKQVNTETSPNNPKLCGNNKIKRSLFKPSCAYYLDVGTVIFVWVGNACSPKLAKDSNLKCLAMDILDSYSVAYDEQSPLSADNLQELHLSRSSTTFWLQGKRPSWTRNIWILKENFEKKNGWFNHFLSSDTAKIKPNDLWLPKDVVQEALPEFEQEMESLLSFFPHENSEASINIQQEYTMFKNLIMEKSKTLCGMSGFTISSENQSSTLIPIDSFGGTIQDGIVCLSQQHTHIILCAHQFEDGHVDCVVYYYASSNDVNLETTEKTAHSKLFDLDWVTFKLVHWPVVYQKIQKLYSKNDQTAHNNKTKVTIDLVRVQPQHEPSLLLYESGCFLSFDETLMFNSNRYFKLNFSQDEEIWWLSLHEISKSRVKLGSDCAYVLICDSKIFVWAGAGLKHKYLPLAVIEQLVENNISTKFNLIQFTCNLIIQSKETQGFWESTELPPPCSHISASTLSQASTKLVELSYIFDEKRIGSRIIRNFYQNDLANQGIYLLDVSKSAFDGERIMYLWSGLDVSPSILRHAEQLAQYFAKKKGYKINPVKQFEEPENFRSAFPSWNIEAESRHRKELQRSKNLIKCAILGNQRVK